MPVKKRTVLLPHLIPNDVLAKAQRDELTYTYEKYFGKRKKIWRGTHYGRCERCGKRGRMFFQDGENVWLGRCKCGGNVL